MVHFGLRPTTKEGAVMPTAEAGALQQQLEQINAQFPEPIAERITTAVAEVDASGVAPGLAPGEQAPEFSLPDAMERSVSLAERLAGGPVVLVFYRGEWCPYCNTYLRALQAALPDITARGATLLAVGPQSPDHSLSITDKAQLGFDVLSDVDQAVIRAYKVQFTAPGDLQDVHTNVFQLDLPEHTANRSWQLPIPATFVIDRAGVVRAAHVSADYRTRMEPADILAALDELH
jgi:peroxiredoxin